MSFLKPFYHQFLNVQQNFSTKQSLVQLLFSPFSFLYFKIKFDIQLRDPYQSLLRRQKRIIRMLFFFLFHHILQFLWDQFLISCQEFCNFHQQMNRIEQLLHIYVRLKILHKNRNYLSVRNHSFQWCQNSNLQEAYQLFQFSVNQSTLSMIFSALNPECIIINCFFNFCFLQHNDIVSVDQYLQVIVMPDFVLYIGVFVSYFVEEDPQKTMVMLMMPKQQSGWDLLKDLELMREFNLEGDLKLEVVLDFNWQVYFKQDQQFLD